VKRTRVSQHQLGLFEIAPAVKAPPVIAEPPSVDEATRAIARRFEGDLVLRAGAGTGKTHTLVQVVVHLVAGATSLGRAVPPARILLLTFSEKAAAELRDRVRARFAELAAHPDPTLRLDAHAWRTAAAQLGAAPISTFHGYASGLLRRHAAAAGIDGDFDILVEDEAETLVRAQAETVVLAALDRGDHLVRELVRELDWTHPPDLPLRGLIDTIVDLVAQLRETGARDPRLPRDGRGDAIEARARLAEIQAATATACADVALLLAAAGPKLAERGARLAALAPQIALAAPDDPTTHRPLADALEIAKGNLGNETRNAARNHFKEVEASWRRAFVAIKGGPMCDALAGLVDETAAAYVTAKRARGVLDFADLVAQARALLSRDAAVRASESGRWDAVLVDEFQDTNGEQDELVTLVRGQARLLVVGDPKQSIYEFRGADVSLFEQVGARIEAAGGQSLALTESRRGRAPLTELVNRLFARSMRGGPHPFEVAFDPARDALHAWRGGDGVSVDLLQPSETEDPAPEEPALVARYLRNLVESERPVVHGPDGPRAARWGDVAILLRRFNHLDAYLGELRRARIPHYVVNGRGFYEAQEVRDLVHALAVLDDPDDALSWIGVLRSPLVGVSDRTLALAVQDGKRLGAEVVGDDLPPAERARWERFLALHRRLRRHADRLGAYGTLRAIVDETDLEIVLAASHHGEQRIANLERLLALAGEHDAKGRGDRRAFARRLRAQTARERSLVAPAQILGERDDVVRIMTIHQSKGLEFPVVFVPECGAAPPDRAPSVTWDRDVGVGMRLRLGNGDRAASPRAERIDERRKARAQAESLRLFYVATTRARDLLVLSATEKRTGSWWSEVHELLAEDVEARALVRWVAPEKQSPPPAPTPPPPRPATRDEAAAIARAFSPPIAAPRLLRCAVTELATFSQCPRRWHLRHEVGLGEWPILLEDADRALRAVEGAPDEEALALVMDPASRGTLAHRILERLDFAAGPDAARALVEAEAATEAPAERERLAALVLGVLGSALGRELAGRPPARLRREAPFLLHAAGERARLAIKGQMDLVLLDDDRVTVLDYKLTSHGSLEPYLFQLETYAHAARAVYGRPAVAGVVFLRPGGPLVRLLETPADPSERLGRLADELALARGTGITPGRDVETCRRLECGYLTRCHG
jgi:ATP-dependent helicase/nuclease subunit A